MKIRIYYLNRFCPGDRSGSIGMEVTLKRIGWIDVLKFLGIFAIYYWHLCEGEGRAYQFILWYHVPLFFFLSGCTEAIARPLSFGKYVKKKTKNILLPFFFFALLSMLLVIVYEGFDFALCKLMLRQILYGGVRNQIFAYSLWFLSCLYVMSILFWGIRQVKKRSLILGIGILCFVFAARVMPYKPNMVPIFPYNADCALYYMVYYCLGYCIFPRLQKFLEEEGGRKKPVLGISGGCCAVYAVALFWEKDGLAFLNRIPVVRIFHPLVVAAVLIWLNLVIAVALQRCRFMQKLGTETLYLCGNEFLVKTLVVIGCSVFGIGMEWRSPVTDVGYVFGLILLVHFLGVAWQRRIVGGK